MNARAGAASPGFGRAALALWIALYALVVVRTAWLCDDAYITYRTVDNLVNGLGLRWNVAERVQAYTHPLWMLLVSAGYAASGNVYWTALGLSFAASLAAVVCLAAGIARSPWNAAVAVAALVGSSAFVDYSTSGLENPLTHALLAAFAFRLLGRPLDGRNLWWLSGLASLAAVNRLDTLLLYLPALAWALVAYRRRRGLAIAAAGFAPLAAWETFSLVYYGFLFPNTAYAKLKLFLPRAEVWAQGLAYLENSLRLDPVTLATLAAGVAFAALGRCRRELALAGGALLYVAYVVSVGGDFMAGRLWTAPFFCGAVLLARAEPLRRARGAVPALGVLFALGFAAPNPSFLSGIREGLSPAELIAPSGIADERRYYETSTGLASWAAHRGVPAEAWTHDGERARREGRRLVLMSFTGFFGFAAGPGVHIVDQHGLSEPFLARLPPPYRPDWRIGHVWRELPAGYWETQRTGTNRLADPGLARYYEVIERITRGPLWSAARWQAIAGMALGRYEGWIDVQRYRFPPAPALRVAHVAEPRRAGVRVGTPGTAPIATTAIEWPGLDVVLAEPAHARRLEVSVGGDDAHAFVFFRGSADLAIAKLPRTPGAGPGLAVRVVEVPVRAREAGFDRVRVMPWAGDGQYVLGQLRPLPPAR